MLQADYKKKKAKKKKPFIYSKISIFLVLLIIIAISFGIADVVPKMIDTENNKKIAEKNLAQLRGQEENVIQQIKKLASEEGREKIIREKFRVAKEGEGLILILDDEDEIEKNDYAENNRFMDFLRKLKPSLEARF